MPRRCRTAAGPDDSPLPAQPLVGVRCHAVSYPLSREQTPPELQNRPVPTMYPSIFTEMEQRAQITFHSLFHREPDKGREVVGDDGGVGLRDQGEGSSPRCICDGSGGAADSEARELAF